MSLKGILAKQWLQGATQHSDSYYEELVPVFPEEQEIPYTLHQIYLTRQQSKSQSPSTYQLPREIQQNIERICSENPEMTYTLWKDEAVETFIKAHYGDRVYQYYLRINPSYAPGKADFFRYLLIYRLGGLYLDLKSNIVGNFKHRLIAGVSAYLAHWDNLPGDLHERYGREYPLAHETEGGEYIQWMLWFAPGHPLLRAVIIEMLKRIDNYTPYTTGVGASGILDTTGPWMYTTAILNRIKGHNQVHIYRSCLELGLQYSIYDLQSSDLERHKTLVTKGNYRDLLLPFISPNNKLASMIHKVYALLQGYYHKFFLN